MAIKKCILVLFISLLIWSCKESVTDTGDQTGSLQFIGTKTLSTANSAVNTMYLNKARNLIDSIYLMHTIDLKINVREIWVSQGTITAGNEDNLVWKKIGENNQWKWFNEYSFTTGNMPVGQYKSIKISFTKIFYRQAAYHSDHSNIIEMQEIMGSWNDTTGQHNINYLAPITYLSSGGTYQLENNRFKSVNPRESVSAFEIKAGKVTKLYWKLGDERNWSPYDNIFEWIDVNKNDFWDCYIDRMDNFQSLLTPPLETMWIFVPVYE